MSQWSQESLEPLHWRAPGLPTSSRQIDSKTELSLWCGQLGTQTRATDPTVDSHHASSTTARAENTRVAHPLATSQRRTRNLTTESTHCRCDAGNSAQRRRQRIPHQADVTRATRILAHADTRIAHLSATNRRKAPDCRCDAGTTGGASWAGQVWRMCDDAYPAKPARDAPNYANANPTM